MLPVSEQFFSIQGEGPSLGRLANFIRLEGCPNRCYFCDSSYAWKEKESNNKSVEDILNDLDNRAKIVVITGGEPLIHDGNESFIRLLHTISKQLLYEIEVETSAIKIPSVDIKHLVERWNVSPKLSNSGIKNLLKVEYKETIPFFVKYVENSIFKFVVKDFDDVVEVNNFVVLYNVPKSKIYLMPEGSRTKDQLLIMEKVVEWAKEFGFGITPRLHTLIWDGKRGT